MKHALTLFSLLVVVGACASHGASKPERAPIGPAPANAPRAVSAPSGSTGTDSMQLGNFSVSLAVKDLAASRAFYEKLGFRARGGNADKGWLVMQNDSATIGLFQGMFDKNILTFNPGWDRAAQSLQSFDDVRDIQKKLASQGITPVMPADETGTGPASCVIVDPDGNQILIDQHVPRPTK